MCWAIPTSHKVHKEPGPHHNHHKAVAMLRIYIISLTSILAIQATLIPSLPPWSAYQYAKQNNIHKILQIQSFPHYTWSPLTLLEPTFAHSLALYGTEKGYSLQNDIEESSESGDVPLERFEMNGEMSLRLGIESQKMRNNFREFWGIPWLG